MSAFLVIALTKRDDRPRLRRIGQNYDLCRSLAARADHFLSRRAEADRPRRSHRHIISTSIQRPAAHRKCSFASLPAYAEVLAVRNVHRPKARLQPLASLLNRSDQLLVSDIRGHFHLSRKFRSQSFLERIVGKRTF